MHSQSQLFTKWNLVLIVLFVAVACFLVWLSRRARNKYSDVGRLGGVMLSMMTDHSRPTPSFDGSNSMQQQAESPRSCVVKRHRFSQKQRHYIASIQGYNCFLCNRKLSRDLHDADIDHILPLSLGGRDWPNIDNLALLHTMCHRKKTIEERARAKRMRGNASQY